MTSVVFAALAVCLVLLGRWGRRHCRELVPGYLDEEERERRVRALRQGATLCQIFAVIFAVAVIAYLVQSAVS